MIRAMLLALVCTAVAAQASAADGTFTRLTLKGLKGVQVVVEGFDEANRRAGFDETMFRTDVELKLRMAGIRVLSEEEKFATPGRPWLYLVLNPLHESREGSAAFSIGLEFWQDVRLDRDPSVRTKGATWSIGHAGIGPLEFVRRDAKDMVDQFINAWLSVNPKD